MSPRLHLEGADESLLYKARQRFQPQEPALARDAEEEGATTAYVEFIGFVDARWLEQLRRLGIKILAYHPENSYLCYGPVSAFREALKRVTTTTDQHAIKSVTDLTSDLKIQIPKLGEDGELVVILVVATLDERANVLNQLKAVPGVDILDGAGNDVFDANRFRVRARVRLEGLTNLLKLPHVLSVEPFDNPVPEDEVAGLVIAGLYDASYRPSGSYVNWLKDHGIDGQGVTIGIVDGGVDISHPAFTGRARDLAGGQKDWHATMVAGHAAGNYLTEIDSNGLIYGIGTAPAATILSQDKMQATTDLCKQTVILAGSAGAIQNNSWGKGTHDPMDYGSDEALYDALVRNASPPGAEPLPLTICFSSGNSGPLGLTRPKAAKNLIITGNSENYRPDVSPDGSDNIREVYEGAHGSSYGNCGDKRIRPHIVAPGEWTSSANFDCHPGEDEYISPMLTWGGGSSGACPKTAGACALLTQWWRRNNNGQSPSPAMLRALIVNGAEPILTGGPIPNNRQGWGRLNIQNIVDPSISRILEDQKSFLSQPTETREWHIRAVDPTKPVKITLAWTDPPGAIGTGGSPDMSPVVNKLALRAESGGNVYRGIQDRFRDGVSTSNDEIARERPAPVPGESPVPVLEEGTDNLQNIFLSPASAKSLIRVSVTALNVTTNCLNMTFDTPQQDFALVITNAQLDTGASPPNVAVAVDSNANRSTPLIGSNGYWSSEPGNSDHDLLSGPADLGAVAKPPSEDTSDPPPALQNDSEWWDAGDTGTSFPPPSSQEDSPWWSNGGQSTRPSETKRHQATPRLTDDAEFAGKLAAGFKLLNTANYQANASSLDDALTVLMERFRREVAESSARPFSVVLVVGAGTRVTVADIQRLRALSAAGRVFLVSGNSEIIAFLAQRIGNQPSIQYRLATSLAELPDLVLDTMAEAAGLQSIIVADPISATNQETIIWTYRFNVAAGDRAIVIHIRFQIGSELQQIRLMRPGYPVVNWNPMGRMSQAEGDVSISFQDGLLETRVVEVGGSTGTWTVEFTGKLYGQPPSLMAWALGGPWISVSAAAVIASQETGRASEGRQVRMSGEPGVILLQATIQPPRMAAPAGTIAGEAPCTLVAQVRRSRLDSRGNPVAEDDRQLIPVPVLSQVLKVTAPTTVASVLDLPINIQGIDAKGNNFARRVRTNLVRLRPLSQWQAEVATAAPQSVYVRGYIAEVKFQNGLVVALQLRRGTRFRTVNVTSPTLGKVLATFDLMQLRDKAFIFGVHGGELCSILRSVMSDSVSTGPGDHGVAGPIQEVTLPRTEASNADYPDATRFVPAASFRASGSDRTINRVVIHITDGGSSINGPISWFQNPASGVSSHYIVGQNGEVVQMVRDRDIAWHANRANGDSIGIEHCARAPKVLGPNDPGLIPTPLQYEASAALVQWLCDQYGIPVDRDHILGHSEVDPNTTHVNCPNAVWDWDYYMEILTTGASVPLPGDEAIRRRQNGLQSPKAKSSPARLQ
jgi:N-acetyl-anhydromuramyl-L-alanine amidase AmpD